MPYAAKKRLRGVAPASESSTRLRPRGRVDRDVCAEPFEAAVLRVVKPRGVIRDNTVGSFREMVDEAGCLRSQATNGGGAGGDRVRSETGLSRGVAVPRLERAGDTSLEDRVSTACTRFARSRCEGPAESGHGLRPGGSGRWTCSLLPLCRRGCSRRVRIRRGAPQGHLGSCAAGRRGRRVERASRDQGRRRRM